MSRKIGDGHHKKGDLYDVKGILMSRSQTLVELSPTIEPVQALPDRVYSVLKYRYPDLRLDTRATAE